MTRREALQKLFQGMHADVQGYRRLRELLDEQFEAALQHRTEQVREVVERISALAQELEARRRERVDLVGRLAPRAAPPSIGAVAGMLQGAARATFESCWSSLEKLVHECKRLNQRNCRLLMDQYEIMRRVLDDLAHGAGSEAGTYAPA